jgi:SAM-dependent methyltransferase
MRWMMEPPWPVGFVRVPAEPWTEAPVDALALQYDDVRRHQWYGNLDPTLDEVAAFVRPGGVLADYSGGTGIFIERLLERRAQVPFGIVNVDSSPKFLRLSLEKLGRDPRVAFRLLRWRREEKRLDYVDEVLGSALVERRLDAIVSTNALHLYADLDGTLASWRRVVRSEGCVFVQSGNVRPPHDLGQRWIIADTVAALQRAARAIVAEDDRFAPYREALDDPAKARAYAELTARYFLPVRPLEHYLAAFRSAGFEPLMVRHLPVTARVAEWGEFLAVYHEGVLGWVGGAEKVEGRPASEGALRDRRHLLRLALDRVFAGRETFQAEWTYLTLVPR